MLAGVPIFLKRSAVTRELFNLIIEFQLRMTAGGMEEHIRRMYPEFCSTLATCTQRHQELHLLEYQTCKYTYIRALQARLNSQGRGQQLTLHGYLTAITPFSEPYDLMGYADSVITHDLITDVYLGFSIATCAGESAAYLRTLTGMLHAMTSC